MPFPPKKKFPSGGVSIGALERRFHKVARGHGAPGPDGGKKQLAPAGPQSAGSMFVLPKGASPTRKKLHNLPKPGR